MGKSTCFMSGSRIRAARGDIAVDMISPGDTVVVLRGGAPKLEPVKWIGQTYVDVSHHPNPEQAAPIHFRPNAIADNQPGRDLFVSPEHCLIIDGFCIPAKLLVNGGAIVSERDYPPFTYYHLELEQHGILLAENTPAESYLDTGNRSLFDSTDEPRQLHPDFTLDANSARWLTDACAPLARVPEDIEPVWRRLAERSAALGYPIPSVATVDDADVHLLADGQAVQPLSIRNLRYVFAVPAGTTSVTLVSRFCIPSDKMIADQRDTRRLGVCVGSIEVRCCAGGNTTIPPDHPALRHGWNDFERDGTTIWRWTDGAGVIPWQKTTHVTIVTVQCSPVDRYPLYDERARMII